MAAGTRPLRSDAEAEAVVRDRRASSRDEAMLAHDLRGALQGILGGISVIDGAEVDPDLRWQLERVFAAAETVSCLLNVFLDDAPDPAAGTISSCVNISAFLAYLQRRWTGEARHRGLEFALRDEAGPVCGLYVEPVALSRVIGNLIGNSICHAGSGRIEVTVAATAEGGLAFRLRDDGPGVTQTRLDDVARNDDSARSKARAHGLGLRIVQELSVELGGALSLGNRPGGGFGAELRFDPSVCLNEPPLGSEDMQTSVARADLEGVSILLAEDNPTNQMVATQMLRALKARVTIASDGVEALDRFENGNFDLVLVDIEMPRLSGLDVIRAIRGRADARARVPIVALTAYALREHQDRIASAGANGLISKPISSIEALGRALRGYLDASRVRATDAAMALPGDPSEPVVDLVVYEALREAIGADMMAELMEKVVSDLLSARNDLVMAMEPLELAPVRSASHILISVAGAIGASRLQSCARDLNIAAHDATRTDTGALLRHCLDELDAAVAFARVAHPPR